MSEDSLLLKKLGILTSRVETVPLKTPSPPRLRAQLIGINTYEHRPLTGPVNDINRWQAFLTDDLKVPLLQIKTLKNEQATRVAIIQSFRELQKDDSIKRQDPILIVYAGHGTKLDKPNDWSHGEDKIEALVPHDVGKFGPDGEQITAIPDRTIATLLNDLAEAKGDNIVLIFDCCHSTSMTRSPTPSERMARYLEPKFVPALRASTDKDILPPESSQRHLEVAKGYAYSELRSHVLVAACGAGELAYETNKGGDFTCALLPTLANYGVDRMTYKGCMLRLPALQSQNPQCEGMHKDRIFFNAQVPGSRRLLIPVRKKSGQYVLSAGTAQNITHGAVFAIFAHEIDDPNPETALGRMRVDKADPTQSELVYEDDENKFYLPDLTWGFQTHCGSDQVLRVHFTEAVQTQLPLDDEWYTAFTAKQTNIVIQPCEAADADVTVDLAIDQARFEVHHELLRTYAVQALPDKVPLTADEVLSVLRASALFIWHLNQTNPETNFGQDLRLEFKRVKRNSKRELEPFGNDLNQSGVATIKACPDDLYGITIHNNTPHDLFPYLFYFDVGGLSIEKWNDSKVGPGQADAPLPKNSFLTIGYGSGGSIPFAFQIERPLSVKNPFELGVIKLYVTNQQSEFGTIDHASPFDLDKHGRRKNVLSTEVSKSLTRRGVWHTLTLTLVQEQPSV